MALPKRIVEAAARARDTRIPGLSPLPRRARALLAYIVEHVSANDPTSRVRHDDDYVSARLSCSRRTITTAVTDLEEAGLIERPEQSRLRGRFHSAGYKLTTKAIDLLFVAPCANSADEINNTVPTSVVITTDNDRPIRVGKVSLPPSLSPWLDSGLFTAADLLVLMKLAKKANTRLQDVLTACKSYLMSGIRKPAAYVATLLKSNKDWSYIARSTQQRLSEKAKEADAVAKRNELFDLIKNAAQVIWRLENMTVTMDKHLHLAVQTDGDSIRYTPMDLHWAVKLHGRPYQVIASERAPQQATTAVHKEDFYKPSPEAQNKAIDTCSIRLGNYRTEQGLTMTIVRKARQLMLSIAGNHILLPSSAINAIKNNQWEFLHE